MAGLTQTTRVRFWRWLIRFIGGIVPRHFRNSFRQEWEAELGYREEGFTASRVSQRSGQMSEIPIPHIDRRYAGSHERAEREDLSGFG